MLTQAEQRYFIQEQEQLEASYLAGSTPQKQSGFGRNAHNWKRFRHPVVEPVHKDGSFLDVGCANGLLMEGVVTWARESGREIEVFGLDISKELAELARRRLPHWKSRIYVGNAFLWDPPARFDFVRTELVYVPPSLRRRYVERLLDQFVARDGKLIICSYGSSRPEGTRAEPLVDELQSWGIPVASVHEVMSYDGDFVITRVVAVEARRQPNPVMQRSALRAAADHPNRVCPACTNIVR